MAFETEEEESDNAGEEMPEAAEAEADAEEVTGLRPTLSSFSASSFI